MRLVMNEPVVCSVLQVTTLLESGAAAAVASACGGGGRGRRRGALRRRWAPASCARPAVANAVRHPAKTVEKTSLAYSLRFKPIFMLRCTSHGASRLHRIGRHVYLPSMLRERNTAPCRGVSRWCPGSRALSRDRFRYRIFIPAVCCCGRRWLADRETALRRSARFVRQRPSQRRRGRFPPRPRLRS